MSEGVLIKGKKNSLDLIVIALVIFGVVLSIALFVGFMISHTDYYDAVYEFVNSEDHAHYSEFGKAVENQADCWFCERIANNGSQLSFLLSLTLEYFWGFIIPVVLSLVAVVIYVWIGGCRLTVTNERVYGKGTWGKKVGFPVDTVLGATTCGLSGVAVSTTSGTTKFLLIKNADAVCAVINDVVNGGAPVEAAPVAPVAVPVQTASTAPVIEEAPVTTPVFDEETVALPVDAPVVEEAPAADPVAELKRYKELLDNDIITQEEFDAKKKQLLNL